MANAFELMQEFLLFTDLTVDTTDVVILLSFYHGFESKL